MTIYVDLVMDNGELTRIECPDKFEDALHDSLADAMKRRDWWSPERFERCNAMYMGLSVGRVNMARVVATL